jgi:hypothetical protein
MSDWGEESEEDPTIVHVMQQPPDTTPGQQVFTDLPWRDSTLQEHINNVVQRDRAIDEYNRFNQQRQQRRTRHHESNPNLRMMENAAEEAHLRRLRQEIRRRQDELVHLNNMDRNMYDEVVRWQRGHPTYLFGPERPAPEMYLEPAHRPEMSEYMLQHIKHRNQRGRAKYKGKWKEFHQEQKSPMSVRSEDVYARDSTPLTPRSRGEVWWKEGFRPHPKWFPEPHQTWARIQHPVTVPGYPTPPEGIQFQPERPWHLPHPRYVYESYPTEMGLLPPGAPIVPGPDEEWTPTTEGTPEVQEEQPEEETTEEWETTSPENSSGHVSESAGRWFFHPYTKTYMRKRYR